MMTPVQCIEKYLVETMNMQPEAAATFAPDILASLVENGFQVGDGRQADGNELSFKEMVEVRNQALDYAIRTLSAASDPYGSSRPDHVLVLSVAGDYTGFMLAEQKTPVERVAHEPGDLVNQAIDAGLLPARGQSD